jgi:hypothetical protein
MRKKGILPQSASNVLFNLIEAEMGACTVRFGSTYTGKCIKTGRRPIFKGLEVSLWKRFISSA